MKSKIFSIVFTALLAVVSAQASSSESEAASSDTESNIVIKVNEVSISESEFEISFRSAVKNKYYHGQVPEGELQDFRKQVANDLVDQVLIYSKAITNGLESDRAAIEEAVDAFDSKNAHNPEWQKQREKVLPIIVERLERENLIEKMESSVKDIPQPDENRVREYYRSNPEKFTEPKRVWVSLILLSVPPSGSTAMWNEALKAAEQIRERYQGGEEFIELVKAYSDHISAENGGDLGYLHQGMLAPEAQEVVESLAIDEITVPVRTLEGIVLLRLNGIRESSLRPFDEVKQRAASLLYRDLQENAWSDYITALKDSADIFIDKALTVPTSHE